MFGVNEDVQNLTAEQIRENDKLNEVCFFEDYINICKEYNMIPIVEIKSLNKEGVQKMVETLESYEVLDKARFFCFDSDTLIDIRTFMEEDPERYEMTPYLGYLLYKGDVVKGIEEANDFGFSGVNIQYTGLTNDVYLKCRQYGLVLGTWTYKDNVSSIQHLYEHVVSGKYSVDSITTDYAFFK